MKVFATIVGLLLVSRLMLWLFPQSDTVWNYILVCTGGVAVLAIVTSEIKNSRRPVE